eukprot:scaffold3951_cov121-Isochrysis_galbana.AAC.5
MTGSGTDTGAAVRRGHDDLRLSKRRTYLGDATAHWATAARARHTDFSQCLSGGRERRERNGSTLSGAAREREARRAQRAQHAPVAHSRVCCQAASLNLRPPLEPSLADRLPDQPPDEGADGRVHREKRSQLNVVLTGESCFRGPPRRT